MREESGEAKLTGRSGITDIDLDRRGVGRREREGGERPWGRRMGKRIVRGLIDLGVRDSMALVEQMVKNGQPVYYSILAGYYSILAGYYSILIFGGQYKVLI